MSDECLSRQVHDHILVHSSSLEAPGYGDDESNWKVIQAMKSLMQWADVLLEKWLEDPAREYEECACKMIRLTISECKSVLVLGEHQTETLPAAPSVASWNFETTERWQPSPGHQRTGLSASAESHVHRGRTLLSFGCDLPMP
jgi:hypothetical protein